eukprot:1178568-Prorocentrum_minimum.AAC.1
MGYLYRVYPVDAPPMRPMADRMADRMPDRMPDVPAAAGGLNRCACEGGVSPLQRSDVPLSAVDYHCSNIVDEVLADPQVSLQFATVRSTCPLRSYASVAVAAGRRAGSAEGGGLGGGGSPRPLLATADPFDFVWICVLYDRVDCCESGRELTTVTTLMMVYECLYVWLDGLWGSHRTVGAF